MATELPAGASPHTWRCPACRQLNRPGTAQCVCGQPYGDPEPIVSDERRLPPLPTSADGINPYAPPRAFVQDMPQAFESAPAQPVDARAFLSIWTQPRQTIRAIVDSDPTKHVIWLAMLSGFFQFLDRATDRNLGDRMSTFAIVGLAVLVSPMSILGLYLGGMLAKWAGSLLGGVASREEVRAAFAWGSVPFTMWSIGFWPVWLVLFGGEVFREATPRMEATSPVLLLALVFGALIAAIWSIVVFLKCLGEVHRFSAWKALGAMTLLMLVIVTPFVAIALIAAVIAR